ncbi:cobalt-precorrin 5A hydrolase [Paucibacter oligotrophus]|uniref:Cobalt-precorrin 5A hydrolase n=1 Tax=Roseateles oligotrophus TaxID=1769250 RepID=A0A840L7S4_9BURK|nr:cobalamin biosynthesis central domain-containing protein [Roseateles oligotrophus]MBB4843811.1 cobalt-precorrin 5A hydrolase [Roseateles oligotrophus]
MSEARPDPAIAQTVRVVLVAITKHGAAQVAALAAQLPQAQICVSAKFADLMQGLPNPVHSYSGAFKDEIAGLFQRHDQIVFFVSLGAVVRLIAPFLKSKDEDPGVLVVDDAGQFVIPVLSGHVGGANAWAEKIALLLQATPVLTTASDVGKTIPVDILGRELGWVVECPKINITRVSAAVVNEEPVAVVQEAGSRQWWTRPTPLPANIHLFDSLAEVDLARFKAVLWITHAEVPEAQWQALHERLVVYRPPRA